jgi:hypothetical protein
MQKRIAGSILVTLAILMALMPLAKAATHYWWDSVYFVDGINIKYPHPDRDYYLISPYSDWTKAGTKLYHNQINHDTSQISGITLVAICAIAGAVIGFKIAPPYGALIGAVAGAIMGAVTAGYMVVIRDEIGCIWWWTSVSFMSWLEDNSWWLGPALLSPLTEYIAIAAIEATFILDGYLRIGDTTIYDAVGAGSPAPPPSPPPSGGGCPILSVWDGTDYFEEGLLDIHNPEGIDVVYQHTLVSTPQRENDAYLMRLTEHNQTDSHIDQVNLYAILEDGTMKRLPLIYAWHSEDGTVLPQLLFSDDVKTDTLGADLNNGTSQSIDLKFASLSPNLEIIGFVFEIEGNNRIAKR